MANESSDIYKPLDPNRNEIRVLRLKPRQYNRDNKQDKQRIICFLQHMIIDDAVEYMALSYVWEMDSIVKKSSYQAMSDQSTPISWMHYDN
jgi:hypothetical protein